jgi:hypothetical protein
MLPGHVPIVVEKEKGVFSRKNHWLMGESDRGGIRLW